jgi:hypothetical protein
MPERIQTAGFIYRFNPTNPTTVRLYSPHWSDTVTLSENPVPYGIDSKQCQQRWRGRRRIYGMQKWGRIIGWTES